MPLQNPIHWQKFYSFFHGKLVTRSFCRELRVSEAIATILKDRGIRSTAEAKDFLNPSGESCHNPFLMHNMEKAVRRVVEAVKKREKILIYGDADADGISATALLFMYLKKIGGRVHYTLPYRLTEGRGLNHRTIRRALRSLPSVMLTVDQGSTAVEEVKEIVKAGVDLIITDHHHVPDQLPDVFALVNPKQPDCHYPFKDLCGTGVAFKFIEALQQKLSDEEYWDLQGCSVPELHRYLDLVALATIADHVPLLGENRFYVTKGIELLNHKCRIGLHHLARETRVFGEIDVHDIALQIVPKINACGRLNFPDLGVELLLATSHVKAQQLAHEAVLLNQERYQIEKRFFQQIIKEHRNPKQSALVFYVPNLHQGVISSLTGRLSSYFGRPVIILGDSGGGKIAGSARSHKKVNLYEILQQCSDLLLKFGGHSQALGLELELVHLEEFQERFLMCCSKHCQSHQMKKQVDTWISTKQFNNHLAEEILRLSPFGHGNPVPVFGIQNFELGQESSQMKLLFKDKSWHDFRGKADITCSAMVDRSSRSVSFKIVELKPRASHWFQK